MLPHETAGVAMHSAAVTVAVLSAWLLRLAEAVELTGPQQPELLALTLEVSLALSWVKAGV